MVKGHYALDVHRGDVQPPGQGCGRVVLYIAFLGLDLPEDVQKVSAVAPIAADDGLQVAHDFTS